ncbi:unnamed protein product [Prorocentrum cordatum]|uniref:Pentatricopeptide repeat-containing protein, chloroplastic n=1 Tax=Prorocentrum cordatum TaxID=2364126 RepID=A0ABN9W086_9DINO|nr:unnamed protein product [Polarella glacialis]
MREATLYPSIISYTAGISACEQGEQWQPALALLNEMRQTKLELDVVSYSAGISACGKGEQWQRALALLSEMWKAEFDPNVISCSAGISACEKGDQWQRALALLSEMCEARLESNVVSYNAGISAGEKGRQWQLSLALLREMRESKLVPDVISYSSGASACEKAEQWQRALALLGEMRGARLEPNDVSCNAMLLALERGEAGIRMRRLLQVPPQGAELAGAGGAPSASPPRGWGPAGAGGLHFCIFQGFEQGVEGWSLDRGSVLSRWDLPPNPAGRAAPVRRDGRRVAPGGARLRLCGAGPRPPWRPGAGDWAAGAARTPDGGAACWPVAFQPWEETLWWSRDEAGLPGLEWRSAGEAQGSPEAARRQHLASLQEDLARLPEAAAVLAFTPARPDVSYDQLVVLGEGRSPRPGRLYVLMGGAHGFDDDDDRDGAFAAEVLAAFSARFGGDRVVRVSLGAEGPSRGEFEPKFTLAGVASFLSVEYARGALRQAAAGVGAHCQKECVRG